MALRPLHKCNSAGCNTLTRQPRCEQHSKEKRPSPSKQKPGDPFYSTQIWRDLRKAFLGHFPLCAECDRQGRTEPANEVHHKKKRRDYPELELSWNNLEALCKPCHSRETRRENR